MPGLAMAVVRQPPQTRVQRYYNSAFACRFLGIGYSTLRRWCRKGLVQHEYTVTGRLRFQVVWLEAAKKELRRLYSRSS